MGKLLEWKGRPCRQGGNARGPRSIRSWQKSEAKVDVITGERDTPKDVMEEAAGIFVQEEINEGEMEAAALNASSSERSGYEDDVYQEIGDEYDYLVDNNDGYQGGFSGKSENLLDGSHYNVVGKEDMDIDDNVDDDDDDNGKIDLDVKGYIIGGNSDARDRKEENAEQNMDLDGVGSTSSDYSD